MECGHWLWKPNAIWLEVNCEAIFFLPQYVDEIKKENHLLFFCVGETEWDWLMTRPGVRCSITNNNILPVIGISGEAGQGIEKYSATKSSLKIMEPKMLFKRTNKQTRNTINQWAEWETFMPCFIYFQCIKCSYSWGSVHTYERTFSLKPLTGKSDYTQPIEIHHVTLEEQWKLLLWQHVGHLVILSWYKWEMCGYIIITPVLQLQTEPCRFDILWNSCPKSSGEQGELWSHIKPWDTSVQGQCAHAPKSLPSGKLCSLGNVAWWAVKPLQKILTDFGRSKGVSGSPAHHPHPQMVRPSSQQAWWKAAV